MPRLVLLAHPAVASAVGRELGRDIEYHASLPSTQVRARELASLGASTGIVVANEQTAGQGTHGRAWIAAAGMSLLASWIVRPAPAAPALFTALAGVAVARALAALGREGASLKWPNDVELDGRKVAGALAHGASDDGGGLLVIGIGINVHQRELPAEIARTATSLAIAGHPVDRLALLARLTNELDRLARADQRGAAMSEWRARSTLLERAVAVRSGAREFSGTADSIDDEGALVVRTADGVERVVSGEVRLA